MTHLPINQTEQKDIGWVQEALQHDEITRTERTWLGFPLALIRWYRRHDIELGEAPKNIPAREFDIEIETYIN